MKWPKSAGKSVDDYIEEAEVGLSREQFGADFHRYLNRQESAPDLDSGQLDDLWQIMCSYLRNRRAVEAIRNDRFIEDLRNRQRRSIRLTGYFKGAVQRLDTKNRDVRPSTRLLLGSMRSRIERALTELEEISEIDRLQCHRFEHLYASGKTTADTVWEMDLYLKKVCGVKAEQRNLIISAAIVAARLSEDLGEDFVDAVATRRSRALRKFAGTGMSVDWLAKVPRPRNS